MSLWRFRQCRRTKDQVEYLNKELEKRQESIWKLETQVQAIAELLGVAFSADGEKAFHIHSK